jgi:HK97 family phage prohead protease
MDPRLKAFLDSLRARSLFVGTGIGFASAYIGTLGVGAKGLAASLGIDAAQVSKALKEAADQLVYVDPAAEVTAGAVKTAGGIELFGKSDQNDNDRKDVGDKALMKFENILTTKQTDRDGDDLDPKGAEVDPKAPLLWQHLPDAPIGKMVKVLEQNENYVKTACAIADTSLGHDAAVLVEFGALRISHGFKPKEFEPKGNKADGEDGWKISKYEVMEVSLVSIPANTGAVITAFEKGKLSHPLAKCFAQNLNSGRTKFVTGGWVKSADAPAAPGVNVTVNLTHPAAAPVKGAKGKDTDSNGDATTDPPADDTKPNDGDAAGDNKATPVMLREVMDTIKAMAKDKSLPAEAQARCGLVLSMLTDASAKISEYMKTIADAGKSMDIAGVAAAAAELVAECYTSLTRAADEMGRVGEVAGLPDGALKSVSELGDSITTIVAALDDMTGGTATATAGAADTADADAPPNDPADDDADNDTDEDADAEADDERDGDDDAEQADEDADATTQEGGADNDDGSDDYNAEVTGESTGGADAPADDSGTPADRDDATDADEDDDEDDTDTEPAPGGKDGEVNDGDANPGVHPDDANPGVQDVEDDAEKGAAKSLASLFGEPGQVYDTATVAMLRDLMAGE